MLHRASTIPDDAEPDRPTPNPHPETPPLTHSTEPLFAAATSAAFLGERLKPTGMLGGLAILAACLVTQLDVASLATILPLAAKVSDDVES